MKKLIRRGLSALMSLCILCALSACGGEAGTPSAAPASAAPSEPGAVSFGDVELEMMCWAGGNQEVEPTRVAEDINAQGRGVSINVTSGQNATLYPQMVAAHQTDPHNPLFDICYMNAFSTAQGVTDGLWLAPNLDNIPNTEQIYEAYAPQQGDLGITWALSPMTIYYNPKYVDEVTSWSDLWNEKYAGHVAVWDNLFYSFLLPSAYVLGGDEDNMDPAFEMWADHADQFYCFYTSVDQLKDLFISEDVWIAPFFVGMGLSWGEEGVPVEMAELQNEGVVGFPYVIQLCDGMTQEEQQAAEYVVNELIAPETVENYIAVSPVIPIMPGIKLPDYLKDNYFFTEECVNNAMQFDWEKCAAYNAEWKTRWESEVKAQLN